MAVCIKYLVIKTPIRLAPAFTDFWHLCKSGMICSLLAIPFVYQEVFNPIVDYIFLGVLYNVTFEQFYAKILRRKLKR